MTETNKECRIPSYQEVRNVLTKELDRLSGMDKKDIYEYMHHYLLIDDYTRKHRYIAIRVPGGTVGTIYYDEDNAITKVCIDTVYVVKTYPKDVNEQMARYIGQDVKDVVADGKE